MPRTPEALRQLRQFIHARAAAERPDAELIARLAVGHDTAAFEAVLRRHGELVLGACQRQLTAPEDVEDAFQATFLVLLRSAGRVRAAASLAPWLYGVALRVARHLRQQRRRQPAGVLADVAVVPEDVARRDLCRAIDEEVQRLPEKYRVAVLLCHLQGHTQERAADLLALPVGTVATHVRRGLVLLRGRLTRRGLAPG